MTAEQLMKRHSSNSGRWIAALVVAAMSLSVLLWYQASDSRRNSRELDSSSKVPLVAAIPPHSPEPIKEPARKDEAIAETRPLPTETVPDLTPERLEMVKESVRHLERSRAQHLGTWELGGVSQMMLLFKTPTKDEMDQFAAKIANSFADQPDDPQLPLLKTVAHQQLRAFLDCPFPQKLITFNAPFAEGDPVTFDIAFIAREEHLTIDPAGGPPTFTIAGGVAGALTDSNKTRYEHLFELE